MHGHDHHAGGQGSHDLCAHERSNGAGHEAQAGVRVCVQIKQNDIITTPHLLRVCACVCVCVCVCVCRKNGHDIITTPHLTLACVCVCVRA